MDKKTPAFGLEWTTIVSINHIWITYIRRKEKKRNRIVTLRCRGKTCDCGSRCSICRAPAWRGHRLIIHHEHDARHIHEPNRKNTEKNRHRLNATTVLIQKSWITGLRKYPKERIISLQPILVGASEYRAAQSATILFNQWMYLPCWDIYSYYYTPVTTHPLLHL
jgi:hypothetical protein